MDKLFLVNPTYPLFVTFTRRSETKERGARQTEKKKRKIIKRIPFEQRSTSRNVLRVLDKSHTSEYMSYERNLWDEEEEKEEEGERAYVLIPQTFGTREHGFHANNDSSIPVSLPPSKEAALFSPADSSLPRGGGGEEKKRRKNAIEGGGGEARNLWREGDDEEEGEGMEKRKERKDGANEERWIGRGRVKRTRRAKTEYLIYEYVWGASSQLEKLTATNGRACRSPWSARCPNLESK